MATKKLIPVSVIVTVFNEEATIVSLVAALQQQTYVPTEVVIVDGGSTDRTVELLKSAAKTTNIPLKILVRPGNRSVGRNWAIQHITTDLIAITDAGCVPLRDWLEELVAVYNLQTTDKKIVVAGYYDANPQTAFVEAVVPYVLVMPDKVNPNNFLPATRSMLLDKKVWVELGGFDEQLSDNEDYALAKKIASQPQKYLIVFAQKAKVTWQPRTTLRSFAWMIYRFARGDVVAGIIRPKVLIIFARYIFVIGLLGYLWWINVQHLFWVCLIALIVLYSGWSIVKNLRYVPTGWYWLPVLQFISDAMVILGSLKGLLNRIKV